MINKQDVQPNAWVEIDLKALEYNFGQTQKAASRNTFELPSRGKMKEIHTAPMGIMAVVKADAYGHDMKEVSLVLERLGTDYFGVSDVAEGIQLRSFGIRKPILLFESTLTEHIPWIVKHDLTPTVCTLRFARALSACADQNKKLMKVHVEVDTGMGRLGVDIQEAKKLIQAMNKMKSLYVEGIFTHFPVADTDRKYTQNQIRQLYELVISLDKTGQIVPYVHCANSMGLIGYQTSVLNLTRPGLMLYGLYPNKESRQQVSLKPVMSVKSKVIFVKHITKGGSISYGRSFIAKKNMTVATISIGYNDGFLREFSNKAAVLISGKRCPVVGHVTMDQILVDVSHLKTIRIGQEAVLIGQQKKGELTAEYLAQQASTIPYEIVCHLGNRLPRVFKRKKSMSQSSAHRP